MIEGGNKLELAQGFLADHISKLSVSPDPKLAALLPGLMRAFDLISLVGDPHYAPVAEFPISLVEWVNDSQVQRIMSARSGVEHSRTTVAIARAIAADRRTDPRIMIESRPQRRVNTNG